MTPEQTETVRQMNAQGRKPIDILRAIRHADPTTLILLEEVRNQVKRQRLADLNGRTATQALVDLLEEKRIAVYKRVDTDGCVTHLYGDDQVECSTPLKKEKLSLSHITLP